MKIAEMLAERKAVVELIDDVICTWIRFSDMPGYCKEYDPYKWYFTDNEEMPSDENMDVYCELCVRVKNYLRDYADDSSYNLVVDDNYYSAVVQMLDEDKYHWSENTDREQKRWKFAKEIEGKNDERNA